MRAYVRLWMLATLCPLALACGGDDAPADACTTTAECSDGQRCVDDRCVTVTERDAGGCTDCECTIDDDCAAVAPCAESRCNAGSCEVVVFDERCAPLGICDPTRGCVEAPDAGPTRVDGGLDAGAEDAGTDAGTDAGIDAGPTRGPVGATCDEASDCLAYRGLATSTCLERLRDGTSFVGGYCTMRCTGADDCPDGTACWRAGTLLESYCLAACELRDDCRLGYACRIPPTGTIQPSGTTACYPGRSIVPVE